MRKLFCFVIYVLLTGCISTTSQTNMTKPAGSGGFVYVEGRDNITNIEHVYVGMTRKEVESIIRNRINIGYKEDKSQSGIFKPVTLKNPYRIETLNKDKKSYDVYYYYTNIKKADGLVSEEELTPLVFEQDKLISKSWDSLYKLKKELKL